MDINNFKITPETLINFIQKEYQLVDLYSYFNTKNKQYFQQINQLIKDQQDFLSSLINYYEALVRNKLNTDILKQDIKQIHSEEILSTCVTTNFDLLTSYNLIANSEINYIYKNYFSKLENTKIRHSLILNFIFSDLRGCNCHKNIRQTLISSMDVELMNMYWEQHVWWTRNLIISLIDEIQDEEEVTNRLLKNPADIASLFKQKYGINTSNKIKDLLTEHLVIGKKLILATKQNNPFLSSELNTKWYKNADEIAYSLHTINPQAYPQEKWKELLYSHLDMTKKEVEYRLNKKYKEDILNFDHIEKEALIMAKEMTKGL